jgi:hypothetical protein
MSSASTSSLDQNRIQTAQLPTNGCSVSSKSSSCSSVSSHRSDEHVYNVPPPPTPLTTNPLTFAPPSSLPLLYLNSFSHLLQSSCSSNQGQFSSSSVDERCQSISTSPPSSVILPESQRFSPTNSIPSTNNLEDREEDENTKPKSLTKSRPMSR